MYTGNEAGDLKDYGAMGPGAIHILCIQHTTSTSSGQICLVRHTIKLIIQFSTGSIHYVHVVL